MIRVGGLGYYTEYFRSFSRCVVWKGGKAEFSLFYLGFCKYLSY